jgi:hypothetical protein
MDKESKNRLNSHVDEFESSQEGACLKPPVFQLFASPIQRENEEESSDEIGDSEEIQVAGDASHLPALIASTDDPEELNEDALAVLGQIGIGHLGQDKLQSFQKGGEADQTLGVLDSNEAGSNEAPIQRSAGAEAARVLGHYATLGGTSALVDGPLPFGEIVGAGLVTFGLIKAGTVLLSAPGNQSDTGILEEAQALIRAGKASNICQALDILMADAKSKRDKQRRKRIRKTQKHQGCSHSRYS